MMVKRGGRHSISSVNLHVRSKMTTAARPTAPTTTPGLPINRGNVEETSTGKSKKKNKKKKKRKRQDDDNSSYIQSAQRSTNSRPSSAPTVPPPPTPKKHMRTQEKPARFIHPQLDAELRRLGRSWLSPGDPLFKPALERSYRGMRHEPADSLPPAVHKGFRQSFDSLNEAGLFLYDTVQAGGKRLSRTFVTRTLVGDSGITYKYLGLRLFAHPWDRGASDFRKGPGDGLADALNDPCISDLFSEDGVSNGGDGARGVGRAKDDLQKSSGSVRDTNEVADALRKLGDLSDWMRLRAADLLEEASNAELVGGVGSCAFNLTLINRMECSGSKRDLKPDPLFSMGKCSVSWHADSCLQDFSTIGVYHCTDPVPADPDWGIALRVSQEAEVVGDADGDAANDVKARMSEVDRRVKSGAKEAAQVAPASARAPAGAEVVTVEREEVMTPPLLVPLQSGDAYFLLDDFNHFHEHAVVSGSSTLRYSSTHRVADTDGNTFSHVQQRCEETLAGGGEATGSRQILNLVQVRAEQALLTELESEWLNQFWVQGRRHAILHPWWRGPMALILATWRELERRTALSVQRLISLREDGLGVGDGGIGGSAGPATIAKAFETVLRALEERRQSRSRWDARFTDPAYRSLPLDLTPVVPALWPSAGIPRNGVAGGGGEENGEGPLLPWSLDGVISRLRECYTGVYRAVSGGKKAGSAKAIAAGAASNWELLRAASGGDSSGKNPMPAKKQQQQSGRQHAAGKDDWNRRERHAGRAASVEAGGDGGGDSGRGREPKGKSTKSSRKRRAR